MKAYLASFSRNSFFEVGVADEDFIENFLRIFVLSSLIPRKETKKKKKKKFNNDRIIYCNRYKLNNSSKEKRNSNQRGKTSVSIQ